MVAVYTVPETCKKCYSCVRSCPTKALQVREGQAEIIPEFCISCGWCVKACSQGAKRTRSSLDAVQEILRSGAKTYALLAPSFPAAFLDVEPARMVGALEAAGFCGVFEVAFGADLVSYEYHRRFNEMKEDDPEGFLISSPCPAVVLYIEKMVPELAPRLADVVSPMEATARVVKQKFDASAKAVFLGPCVAKKVEASRSAFVDEALTFAELNELFLARDIDPRNAAPAGFTGPRANLGRIYPVTGGLLKAASIDADILESPVSVVEGQERVMDILDVLARRVRTGEPTTYRLFDLLFCEGCIGGPVMVNDLTFYERKKFVVQYMRDQPAVRDIRQWAQQHVEYLDLDLTTKFSPVVREEVEAPPEEITRILAMTGKLTPADELNCGACGYPSCRQKALAVWKGKAEVEMCLPYLISKIEKTVRDLTDNQARLIQAEKLASMGQMAAGIAHEINNPLGVVLMYAHLLNDELADDVQGKADAERIILEAERARQIVRGILNFAREEKVDRRLTDINRLVTASASAVLGTSQSEKYRVEFRLDQSLSPQSVDPSQLRQVFDNIIKNAVEAIPDGGAVTLSTQGGGEDFSVTIEDTGPGISQENLSKMFTPFFTTKKVGRGTGLGLSVCYGIVKMHGGSIQASNRPEGGACFTVRIKGASKEATSGSGSDS